MLFSFRETWGAVPAGIDCTWAQFTQWYREQALTVRRVKHDGPLIAFARFEGGWKDENLQEPGLCALVLDFDHVPLDRVNELVNFGGVFGLKCGLMHTTHSHGVTDGEARLRVIYPSPPLSKAHYVSAWLKVVSLFATQGFEVDPLTGNPARTWFLPGINPNAPEWARTPWFYEFP